MRYLGIARKTAAILANLSLLLNTFLPFLVAIQPVYAADTTFIESTIQYDQPNHKLNITTNSSDKVAYQLFYKTPEKIDAIAGNDLNQSKFYLGTCSSGDCLPQNIDRGILKIESNSKFYSKFFTLENNVSTTVKEIDSSQSDLTEEENNFLENNILGETDSTNWTFKNVELNKEYTAFGVTLVFTKLHEKSGNIKIEEVTLTKEQIEKTRSLSDKAYDITSDMEDGTFAYNLTLPTPKNNNGQVVEVKYAENVSDLSSTQIAGKAELNNDSVLVKNIDHFTVFIVTNPNSFGNGNSCTIASISGICYDSLKSAVDAATDGSTINVMSGTYILNDVLNFDTPNVTFQGVNNPLIQVSGTGYRFVVTASNVKIEGFNIEKTDKTGEQNIIWINANDVSIKNNKIWGKFVIGDNEVSRALVISGGHSGLSIENNEIYDLRQPAYISGITTGNIFNNYVYRTKGWVVEQGNVSFSNNTWGQGSDANMFDIAILSTTSSIYYSDIPLLSQENNNAFIEDQRTPSKTLSIVYVDQNVASSGDGTQRSPVKTLDEALQRVVTGGTINIVSNLSTTSKFTINKSITINGNGHTIFPQFAKIDNSNNSVITIYSSNVTIKNLNIDGSNGTNLHGINLYVVTGILFDSVTVSNNDSSGITVNGSILTVNNLTTASNGWGGINIDQGSGVTSPAKLIVNGVSSHNEPIAIWMDNYNKDVSLVDTNHQYEHTDNGVKRVYTLDKTAPAVPIHISPSDNASINYNDFWFDWDDVSDAVSYEIQNSTDPTLDATGSFKTVMWTGDYQKIQPTVSKASSVGASGTWYWQVRSIDAAGNKSAWSTPWKITIDKVAPTITVNSFKTNDKNPQLAGTVNDNTATISVEINGSTYSATNNNNGTWTLADNTITPNLVDNTYNVIAKATDTAGNIGTDTTNGELVIDSIAPTATYKHYINGVGFTGSIAYVNSLSKLSFTAEYTDPTPSSSLLKDSYVIFEAQADHSFNFAQNGKKSYGSWRTEPNLVTGLSGNNYSLTSPESFTNCVSTLTDGEYYMTHQVYDNAARGNDTTITQFRDVLGLHFIIDTVAPTITIGTYTTAPTNQNITVTATTEAGSTLNVGSTTFTANSSFDFIATDSAGNSTTKTVTITNIDKIAPTSTTNLNDIVKNTVTITQKITDNSKAKSGKLRIWKLINGIADNSKFFAIGDLLVNSNNEVIYTLNTINDLFGDGKYRAKFTSTDEAGNQSIIQKDFTVDNTAPISTIDGGLNNGIVYSNTWSGLISGTASDLASGVNKVLLSIKRSSDSKYYSSEDGWIDGTEETTRVTANNTTIWDFTLPEPLEDSYTIKSHAVDNAGNTENTYTLTIVLDQTIPEVKISLNPTDPDASNGWYKTQPEITLNATDTYLNKVSYKWDSGAWVDYTVPFKLETQGAHILYYKATDLAGNPSSDNGVKNIKWNQTELENGPQNISANPNPTSGSISKIKWEAAKDNDGIDKYEVQWTLNSSTESKSYSKTVSNTTFETEIDQLIEGRWTVKVIAYDASGKSRDNSIDLVVDRTAPSAPTLTLSGTGTGTASLSWNVVSDAKDYILWYGTTSGKYLYGARVGNVTSYTVQGLGAGNYNFIIKAVDAAQNQSGNSNEVNTGNITGAIGTTPGQSAQGFAPEVLGASTEDNASSSNEDKKTESSNQNNGQILGVSSVKDLFNWWWLLLLLFPTYFIGRRFIHRK